MEAIAVAVAGAWSRRGGWFLVGVHDDDRASAGAVRAMQPHRAGLVLDESIDTIDIGAHKDLADAWHAGWRWEWPERLVSVLEERHDLSKAPASAAQEAKERVRRNPHGPGGPAASHRVGTVRPCDPDAPTHERPQSGAAAREWQVPTPLPDQRLLPVPRFEADLLPQTSGVGHGHRRAHAGRAGPGGDCGDGRARVVAPAGGPSIPALRYLAGVDQLGRRGGAGREHEVTGPRRRSSGCSTSSRSRPARSQPEGARREGRHHDRRCRTQGARAKLEKAAKSSHGAEAISREEVREALRKEAEEFVSRPRMRRIKATDTTVEALIDRAARGTPVPADHDLA